MSDSQISTPVVKATTALGAGAGSSALSMTNTASSFLPTDLAGWMALTASTVAVLYTLHLIAEWYWKKVWRDLLERWGWIQPAPPEKKKRRRSDDHGE